MKAKIAFVLLISVFFQIKIPAQNITIRKGADEESLKDLQIYTLGLAFFDYKATIFSLNPNNPYGIDLNLPEISCLYIDYGPYQTYFFAEPGKSYEIILPELNGLTEDWKTNPYFKRSKYHLKVIEKAKPDKESKLNEDIRKFNSYYDPFIDKQLIRYYDPVFAREKLDSFLHVHFSPDLIQDKNYYNNYILYKKGILEFSNKDHDLENIIDEYFTNQKINFSNPAYRELFELVFQSYFFHLSTSRDFSEVFYHLASNDYEVIMEYLSEDAALKNKRIFLTILMHEIYTNYYSANYDKKHLLNILDSIITDAPESSISITAKKLKKSFTSLELSYPVPDFQVKNINNKEISLQDYNGKLVYLGFCNLKSITCLQEIEYLKYLYSRYSGEIEILTCILGEEIEDIKSFREKHSILWEMIPVDPSSRIMEDYKVKAFPIFYFIDKDGTLVSNPTPNPSENFESYLFKFLRSRK